MDGYGHNLYFPMKFYPQLSCSSNYELFIALQKRPQSYIMKYVQKKWNGEDSLPLLFIKVIDNSAKRYNNKEDG